MVTNSAASSPAQGPYHVQAPLPAGHATRDKPQNAVPVETKSNGNGFWKGCCAAGHATRDKPQNAVSVETKSNGYGFWKGCCTAFSCFSN